VPAVIWWKCRVFSRVLLDLVRAPERNDPVKATRSCQRHRTIAPRTPRRHVVDTDRAWHWHCSIEERALGRDGASAEQQRERR
jgi:hypothetical protein